MGAFDATTSVTDGVTDNLAQYHNELKTAADHAMSAAAYAAYGTPASMTGNVTLTDASLPILSYAPTAARDLILPAVATTNHAFYVINRSGTYAITVKDAAAATITTVAVNSTAFLVSDGANSWYPMGGGLTKAAAADVATGTDDAKYVTSKAIKDSVNVPNVAPSTTGNVLTSNGTAWTSAAAGTSLTKAAASDVTTGTDDAKYVTSKAIKDSVNVPNVAPSTTGNVLTSNGTAWTSAAASAVRVDGWIPITGTWTYASATTITVTTGAAALYKKGDTFKLTANSVVLYGYIVGVADTLLTVTGNALTNHAFTNSYYSHLSNPMDFPEWFATSAISWTVSTYDNGSGGQPTNNYSRFNIKGRTCTHQISSSGVKAGAGKSMLFTYPAELPQAANITTWTTFLGSTWQPDTDNLGFIIQYSNSTTLRACQFYASMADNQVINFLSAYYSYEW